MSKNTIRDEAIKWAFTNPEFAQNFKATASWCARFMNRYNLVIREKTKIA